MTLCPPANPSYLPPMTDVTLPPELERFAAEAIAAGRFRDLNELLAAGVDLLKQHEAARAAFVKTLDDAVAEADRDGWLTVEEVHAEMTALIEKLPNPPDPLH